MAVQSAIATGKSSQTATWSNAKKPEAGSDMIVGGGFSVEWNTTGVRIRSIEVQSGSTLSGTAALVMGAATAGNNGVNENVLVLFNAGATITWKGPIEVSSTFTTTAQTISTSGKGTITGLKLESTSTAKVRLTTTFTATGGVVSFVEGGTLELGTGLTHTLTSLELRTGGTIEAGVGSVVRIASFTCDLSNGTLTNGSNLTIELELEGTEVKLNSKTLGALTIKAKNVILDPGAEGATVGTLTVNNKSATVGNGLKITKERRLTVTGLLITDGTEASKARIESTEAGKAAKLKVNTEQQSDGIALQDIAVETGVLYIAKGTNVSGNSEVGTTVKFEAKPAAASTGLGMIV